MSDPFYMKSGEQRRADALAWYDSLVQEAAVSLSKLFDPNYNAVRAVTMPTSPYSDTRGMSLMDMFKETRPLFHQKLQDPPVYEDGWDTTRQERGARGARHTYKGML